MADFVMPVLRNTRYNLLSRPPKDLPALIKWVAAARKRRGAFTDRNQLQGVLGKTGEHDRKGDRDDIIRFFINEGVIIDHDDGRLYYDHDRAQVILGCAARGTVSPPPADPRQRVAAIIAASERPASNDKAEAAEDQAAPEPEALDLRSLPLEEQEARISAAIASLHAQFGR